MKLFVSTFATIFLLAYQSQNVIAGNYASAAITSTLIAAAQITMTKGMVTGHKWRTFFIVAAASVLGVEVAMLVFRNGLI